MKNLQLQKNLIRVTGNTDACCTHRVQLLIWHYKWVQDIAPATVTARVYPLHRLSVAKNSVTVMAAAQCMC